ncbi:hypothetical protein [Pararhizobium sp. IMCC21322]|uniref:hypothetical protein n=1 Tax=Pararhizobium sp. IMCC21322 TaxID=3067903 RepID=UPI00274058F8|nr:hypothetical protein [Pararhizobium sp. IMCC21322]
MTIAKLELALVVSTPQGVGLTSDITVQTFLQRKIATDAQVTLSIPPERITLFDPSGNRCSPAEKPDGGGTAEATA